jgi:hypothetical protein
MKATRHAPAQQTTEHLYRKYPLLAAPYHHLYKLFINIYKIITVYNF